MLCEIVGVSQPVCREHGETVSLRCRYEANPLTLLEKFAQGTLAFRDLCAALDESPVLLRQILEMAGKRLERGDL